MRRERALCSRVTPAGVLTYAHRAAALAGALAICIASPTDLVKVRMQTEGKLAPGCVRVAVFACSRFSTTALTRASCRSVPRKYPSAFAAYSVIARQEGVRGLWTGVGPNIGRNAIINAAELASYDQARTRCRRGSSGMRIALTHTRRVTGEAVAAGHGRVPGQHGDARPVGARADAACALRFAAVARC